MLRTTAMVVVALACATLTGLLAAYALLVLGSRRAVEYYYGR